MIGSVISLFNNILAIFKSVTGPYVMFGLFLAALLYIVLVKEEVERNIFVYVSAIVLVLFFNPVVFWIIGKKILGDQSYCRMLWTVPQVLIMAYAFSDICDRFEKQKFKQAGVVVLSVLILMISGRMIYNTENFGIRENVYGLSDEVVTLVDKIEPSKLRGQKTRISAVPEVTGQIRQLTVLYHPRFDRDGVAYNGGEKIAYNELIKEQPDVDTLIDAANAGHAYLIIKTSQDTPEFMDKGCEMICKTENYVLYCLDNIPDD